jgi:hypothetical protein
VPPESIQELRSLMRTRKQLVREQTRHVQRLELRRADHTSDRMSAALSLSRSASRDEAIPGRASGCRPEIASLRSQ